MFLCALDSYSADKHIINILLKNFVLAFSPDWELEYICVPKPEQRERSVQNGKKKEFIKVV